MVTLRVVLTLLVICAVNVFAALLFPAIYLYFYCAECLAAGLLVIFKWQWTAEFIRANLTAYPFLHYFVNKNITIKKGFVWFLGILIILFGILVFVVK